MADLSPAPREIGSRRAVMSWSSGKDSILALGQVESEHQVDVVELLTTVATVSDRVPMHGAGRSLLEAQAASLGLPLHVVELPWPCSNRVYEQRMRGALHRARRRGIDAIVFGDLFLEDVRRYRERTLRGTGIDPVFPLWSCSTPTVAQQLLACGVRALVTCADTTHAPAEIVGRWYDESLLAALPDGVDPCGENGEFHTVVVDGPGFAFPLDLEIGPREERDGFAFVQVDLRL